MDEQQRKAVQQANRRLGLILLSVVLVFGLGFMAKIALLT